MMKGFSGSSLLGVMPAFFFLGLCVLSGAPQPVAHWPLQDGGSTVGDLSPNGLNGTCKGTEWTTGGEALEFLPPESGVIVRTKSPAPLDCPSAFTITAWIRPASLSGYRMLVSNGRPDSAASGYNFYLRGSALGLILHTERMDRYEEEVPANLAAGRWTHVAVSYEAGGKTVFYADGQEIGEAPAVGRIRYRAGQSHPSVPFALGRVASHGDWFYEGLMREVKIFGSALSAAEVTFEYAATSALASLDPETREKRRARLFTAEVRGTVLDENGRPASAWVTLRDGSGKTYGPEKLFYGNGMFLALQGVFAVKVPPGGLRLTVTRGPEYVPHESVLEARAGSLTNVEVRLARFTDLRARGWHAGEHHFHYRTHGQQRGDSPTWADAVEAARASALSFASYKETVRNPPVAEPDFLCREDMFEGRSHRNIGGHVTWFYIHKEPNPDTFSYLEAKRLGALGIPDTSEQVGVPVFTDPAQVLVRDMVVGAILGETPVWNILKPSSTGNDPTTVWLMGAWYHFLNCGIRLAAGGFTDGDLNVASGNPMPGYGRTYAKLRHLSWEEAAAAYRGGRVFATNGPLLLFTVNGEDPGSVVPLSVPGKVSVGIEALAQQGIERVEIVRNGRVIATVAGGNGASLRETLDVEVGDTAWLAARCYGKKGPHFGSFAHTSPVYVEVGRRPMRPAEEDITFMLDWIAGYRKFLAKPEKLTAWHGSPSMFPEILEHLAKAEAAYLSLRENPRRFGSAK